MGARIQSMILGPVSAPVGLYVCLCSNYSNQLPKAHSSVHCISSGFHLFLSSTGSVHKPPV